MRDAGSGTEHVICGPSAFIWTHKAATLISRLSVSWPNGLEISGFPDWRSLVVRPRMPSQATRSGLVALGLDVPICSARTSPYRAPRPPREATSAAPGRCGKRDGCQGKVPSLRLKRRPAQRRNLRPRRAPVITGAGSVQRRVVVLRAESVVANK